MSDFRSVCRRQIRPVITTPQRARRMKGQASAFVEGAIMIIIRIMP